MEFTETARHILKARYLKENETPEERFQAVARTVAEAERWELQDFYAKAFYHKLLEPLYFLPNSPCIANVYQQNKRCFSACFVMTPYDTIESIYKTLADAAAVTASGGGMGFGLGLIREEGAPVNNVNKIACGPVAVLRILSRSSYEITQGFREGANMAQLPVDHPDIRQFIHVKDNLREINNFNISVQVSDAFMHAVDMNENWPLISRYNGEVVETINARALWNEIIESAWKTGDPGIVFMDRVHETAPNSHVGEIHSSNPML